MAASRDSTGRKIVISRPGSYQFDDHTVTWNEGGLRKGEAAGFPVTLIGDFALTAALPAGVDRRVTVNGRLPLGGIQVVRPGDVIEAVRGPIAQRVGGMVRFRSGPGLRHRPA